MLLPLAGLPLRICLLDQSERTEDCCKKCTSSHKDCCADMDTLPDTPVPGTTTEIPPYIAVELSAFLADDTVEILRLPQVPAFFQPIRGPDTPAAYRSVLSVWSI